MLVDFRVSNFRSIQTEQTLSLVASSDQSLGQSNTTPTDTLGVPAVLRSAAIYGANASGKSNMIMALGFFRGVIAESATLMQPTQKFGVQPFRLDPQSLEQPCLFEMTFLLKGVRHQYGFKITADRVIEEWLLVYKTKKPQQWFSRRYNPETKIDEYEYSVHLTGPRKTWQEATRSNSLYLSTAVQLNSEQLRVVYDWIVNDIVFFVPGTLPAPEFTVSQMSDSTFRESLQKFLSSADVSIDKVDVVSRKGIQQQFKMDFASGRVESLRQESDMNVPQFHHRTDAGSAVFELHEESLGTQRLFAMAGPLMDILQKGRLLIVDELDTSLHSLLTRRLIEAFHSSLNLQGRAQLIFSTHDTSLLDQEIFRRDQIWFTEKNKAQATTLYPLSDFGPRKNEALEKGYLVGRYGAIPFLTEMSW